MGNLIFQKSENNQIDLIQYTIELIGVEETNILEKYFSYMINVDFVKTLKNMKDSISVSSEYIGYYFEKDSLMFFVGSNETVIPLKLYYMWLKRAAELYLQENKQDKYIVDLYLNDIFNN